MDWCDIWGISDIDIPQRVWAKPVVGQRIELFAFPCDDVPIRSRGTPMNEIRSSLTIRLVIIKFCLVFGAFHWITNTWDLFQYNEFSHKYTSDLLSSAFFKYLPSWLWLKQCYSETFQWFQQSIDKPLKQYRWYQ